MAGDIDMRRRRALYRATHRGTKEMDWILGRFAEAHVNGMAEPQLNRFEQLLAVADPEINGWIIDPASLGDSEHAETIGLIRRFHGLPTD